MLAVMSAVAKAKDFEEVPSRHRLRPATLTQIKQYRRMAECSCVTTMAQNTT